MHEAAAASHRIGDAPQSIRWEYSRIVRRASPLLVLVLAMLGVTQRSGAQLPPYPVPLSNTEDARTLPKGIVLFRALNAWTRINDVYDAAADSAHHLHPLGHAFSVASLGVRQFPALIAAQTALRTLTGDPTLSLNIG